MTISLSDAGKRYNRDWIFRHFNYSFHSGTSYAITGPNGSGKSTLLQAIGGALGLSEGKLEYGLATDTLYRHISIAAPYLEVIEEMTVTEFLHFHQAFKPLLPDLSIQEIIACTGLEAAAHKQIRYYSSGMKQRVKLAQAIFSDVPVILLDEPCTNLDAEGIALYQQLIDRYCKGRLVIVSSNDKAEYGFCKETVNILQYK
ncbi:MAG TPA: ATP-binding cassette domain-containing protein [Chitinophagaceae bacterium]|jgi:ABC-type multidrug transport system ATPase subunit